MIDPNALSVALVVLVAGGVLLWRIPGPCTCEKCAFHTNEARMAREAKRADQHRDRHRIWTQVPWEDDRCAQCRLGHTDDKLD